MQHTAAGVTVLASPPAPRVPTPTPCPSGPASILLGSKRPASGGRSRLPHAAPLGAVTQHPPPSRPAPDGPIHAPTGARAIPVAAPWRRRRCAAGGPHAAPAAAAAAADRRRVAARRPCRGRPRARHLGAPHRRRRRRRGAGARVAGGAAAPGAAAMDRAGAGAAPRRPPAGGRVQAGSARRRRLPPPRSVRPAARGVVPPAARAPPVVGDTAAAPPRLVRRAVGGHLFRRHLPVHAQPRRAPVATGAGCGGDSGGAVDLVAPPQPPGRTRPVGVAARRRPTPARNGAAGAAGAARAARAAAIARGAAGSDAAGTGGARRRGGPDRRARRRGGGRVPPAAEPPPRVALADGVQVHAPRLQRRLPLPLVRAHTRAVALVRAAVCVSGGRVWAAVQVGLLPRLPQAPARGVGEAGTGAAGVLWQLLGGRGVQHRVQSAGVCVTWGWDL